MNAQTPAGLRHRSVGRLFLRGHLAVLALFGALTLLFLNPLSWRLAGSLSDAVDPLLNTWILAWDVHALLTGPLHLFDANIFAPYAHTLAYSETSLGSALLLFPLALASDLPVLQHNLALISSFVIGGYTAFLLGKVVTRNTLAALLVGIIFVFNAYRLSMVPKMQMLAVQWLPLALLYLWRSARWGRVRDALLLAFFLVLQTITSLYYGVFTALLVALLAPVFLLVYRRRWPRTLAALILAALLSAALLWPYARPYVAVSRMFGLERSLADALPFAAALRQWALVGKHNLLYGRWLSLSEPPMVGPYPVDYLFPGLLVVIMALLGLIWARKGRRLWTLAAALMALIGFLLSLGPLLMVEPLQAVEPLVTLPYAWLHEHLPGFSALRAPARFAAIVMLGLGLLAGQALAGLRRRGGRPILLAGLVGLVFLESLAWPATPTLPVPQGDDVPSMYGWLAAQPPGAVVELPAALPQQQRLPGRWLWPQYYSIYHWRPTPTGYSGFVPPRHESLIDLLNRFPDAAVLPLYQSLEVRYVLLHRAYYDAAAWQALRQQIDATPMLTPVWEDGNTLAIEVRGVETTAVVTQATLYLPPSAAPATPGSPAIRMASPPVEAYAPLLSLDLAPGSRVFPPGHFARGSVEWRQEGRVRQRDTFAVPLPFLVEERTALRLPLPVPRLPGVYDVIVRLNEPLEVQQGGPVHVADAAPELQALPLALQGIQLSCEAGDIHVRLTWSILGWVDTPQTLYLHLLDGSGDKIAQLDEGLAPPPSSWLPRIPLSTSHSLPRPGAARPAALRLGLYAWSDRYGTIIPARFFSPAMELVPAIEVELADSVCLR